LSWRRKTASLSGWLFCFWQGPNAIPGAIPASDCWQGRFPTGGAASGKPFQEKGLLAACSGEAA
jgi:hypothetical protein